MRTRHSSIHLPLAALLSLRLLFVIGGTVSAHGSISTHDTVPAHAKVYKAIPAIGSTIAQAPTTVIVFTLENINPDPRKSNLFVYGPGGDLISQGNASFTGSAASRLEFTIEDSTLDGHTAANYNPKSHIEDKVVSGIKRERECQAHTLSSAESNTHGS